MSITTLKQIPFTVNYVVSDDIDKNDYYQLPFGKFILGDNVRISSEDTAKFKTYLTRVCACTYGAIYALAWSKPAAYINHREPGGIILKDVVNELFFYYSEQISMDFYTKYYEDCYLYIDSSVLTMYAMSLITRNTVSYIAKNPNAEKVTIYNGDLNTHNIIGEILRNVFLTASKTNGETGAEITENNIIYFMTTQYERDPYITQLTPDLLEESSERDPTKRRFNVKDPHSAIRYALYGFYDTASGDPKIAKLIDGRRNYQQYVLEDMAPILRVNMIAKLFSLSGQSFYNCHTPSITYSVEESIQLMYRTLASSLSTKDLNLLPDKTPTKFAEFIEFMQPTNGTETHLKDLRAKCLENSNHVGPSFGLRAQTNMAGKLTGSSVGRTYIKIPPQVYRIALFIELQSFFKKQRVTKAAVVQKTTFAAVKVEHRRLHDIATDLQANIKNEKLLTEAANFVISLDVVGVSSPPAFVETPVKTFETAIYNMKSAKAFLLVSRAYAKYIANLSTKNKDADRVALYGEVNGYLKELHLDTIDSLGDIENTLSSWSEAQLDQSIGVVVDTMNDVKKTCPMIYRRLARSADIALQELINVPENGFQWSAAQMFMALESMYELIWNNPHGQHAIQTRKKTDETDQMVVENLISVYRQMVDGTQNDSEPIQYHSIGVATKSVYNLRFGTESS